MKIIRLAKHEGLIVAKSEGSKAANGDQGNRAGGLSMTSVGRSMCPSTFHFVGDVLAFMDSHCEVSGGKLPRYFMIAEYFLQ